MGQLNLLANVGIVALMYASAWPFLAPLTQVHEAPVPDGLKLLVALSAVANLVVIAYHYTVPAHPKFLMVPWRRALLRVHITSGTVEFGAGLAALLLPEPQVAARVMAAAALLFHVPGAFAQTPIVFGARAVMRPGYLMCIGWHAFCAVMLLLNPSSAYWVAATFLVFNVYVWCRVYYYLFDKVGLFLGAGEADAQAADTFFDTLDAGGDGALTVGRAVYSIQAGRGEVVQHRDGTDTRVAELGPGEHFVLKDTRRTATVRVLDAVTLLRISREETRPLIQRFKAFGELAEVAQSRAAPTRPEA